MSGTNQRNDQRRDGNDDLGDLVRRSLLEVADLEDIQERLHRMAERISKCLPPGAATGPLDGGGDASKRGGNSQPTKPEPPPGPPEPTREPTPGPTPEPPVPPPGDPMGPRVGDPG
jgi:hypothetical protein